MVREYVVAEAVKIRKLKEAAYVSFFEEELLISVINFVALFPIRNVNGFAVIAINPGQSRWE